MVKIVLVGAGSRSFGPATIRDVLLSDALEEAGVELALVDLAEDRLQVAEGYARRVAEQLGRRNAKVLSTTSLEKALEGADFAVTAIEKRKDWSWAQDFHVPRKHGFKQIYGENGGPGSHFHALRGIPMLVEVARAMEKVCPNATLLNFTNPLHKLCEAVNRLTKTPCIGMCHGVYMGRGQVAALLEMSPEDVDVKNCGINHFTFLQEIRDRRTGEDLYPRLKSRIEEADPLYDWHEIAMSRVLFKRYGLYPSPGTNHFGEYIWWANDFYAHQMLWYYDPAEGHPWETGKDMEFVYTMGAVSTHRPVVKPEAKPWSIDDEEIRPSGEPAVPLAEAIALGKPHEFLAVNIPNEGHIPNLPERLVVEVPGKVVDGKVVGEKMKALPEPLAAMMRLQSTIHQLLVEAYVEESKEKLLQAVLLEPTVDSYRNAVAMVNEMLELQKDLLPPLH
ncbi:MAG TPA: hypothetical protein VGE01_12190 [Fimbriimonas sp.]